MVYSSIPLLLPLLGFNLVLFNLKKTSKYSRIGDLDLFIIIPFVPKETIINILTVKDILLLHSN